MERVWTIEEYDPTVDETTDQPEHEQEDPS